MEAADACEIARIPEELLSAAISLTTPLDACRVAAVSLAFRAAADSDAVWSCFLPRDLPPLADGEFSPAPPSSKGRFLSLGDCPVLLADGLTSMWLDRETGAKCFMLSARKLNIAWDDTPSYWRWIPMTAESRCSSLPSPPPPPVAAAPCAPETSAVKRASYKDTLLSPAPPPRPLKLLPQQPSPPPVSSRPSFSEAAELRSVCWLEIRGKVDSNMLSQNSTYAAYLVFKVARAAYGLDHPEQVTSVTLGGNESTRRVCLDGCDSDGEDRADVFRHSLPFGQLLTPTRRSRLEIPQHVLLPQERADGWKEMELGEFYNDDGEDGEVCISLSETSATLKVGLIVQGIEIRPKKQG